ncbi:hypothetical protein O0L34_g6710 [Tuta absoluta]|nr:hypothetical protein O0L34_g6710 [Tuta absoluta]
MGGRDESAADAPGSCASSALALMGVERGSVVAGGGAATPAGAGGAAAVNGTATRALEPPRKRPKLASDDSAPLRKRILEYKLLRLKSLRDRFTEQLSELYFLQAGGNMMDYAAWRKRPPAPQLVTFLEARRPPALAPPPPDPPPAPAAPTPAVAVAVAPTVPLAATGAASAGATAAAGAQEVVEKARQEAYVARRVAELSRAGLWAERRLPRVLEPPRPKAHWDYLLEEMAWLAQDFAIERKWKKQAAKKCARAVQKYFQDKAVAAQKAEKAQELQLKRIAAFAAKEIRIFWMNVEKLVEWKREKRVERARKEALDEQLSYIVDRTERYSRQLAANLAPPPAAAASPRRSRRGLQPPHDHSPPLSDYGPDADDSADDEDTIAEQERRERAEDTAAELAALQQDAELNLDELVRRYADPPPPHQPGAEDTATDTDTGTDTDTDDELSEDSDSSTSRPLEELVAPAAAAGEGAGEGEGGEKRVEACASLAAALQPTGTTLADTAVGTPVPRLLKHALREYQHVGLHWLATMHARRLNGILADEMGLGKTIQTIALLAHLALDAGDWGPHLVVAPTSVVLNWEMEFKKWCPAFKILTYYGTIKERKLKRVGWTKANSFHVCITSYKLVVQDHQSFRRKKWRYLILDEAQNIKNFKSQRWQMLLNFQTDRRLLLTGTPLQNSLLELWSLMHFLMPAVFASHSHFREWFADVAAAAEGAARNDALVRRLHEVLRPFLLRRLKADVERQMPRKYEHVVMCRLAKRQRFLYDDFMARASTRDTLQQGNLLSVINVLMQLRKVCNHPDLFEPRPVVSPLSLPALRYAVPALALCGVQRAAAAAARLAGDLATLEASGAGAFAAHRTRHLAPPRRLLEELPAPPPAPAPAPAPPRPPPARLRLHLRLVPRAPQAAQGAAPPPIVASRPPPPSRAAAPAAAPAPAPATPAASRLCVRRAECLRRLARTNERRCWRLPLYGADLRAALHAGPAPGPAPAPLPHRTIDQVLADMEDVIDRFSVCWTAARAPAPVLVVGAGRARGEEAARGAGARAWRRRAARLEAALLPAARAALALLHAPAARQAVAFPHPRLLQYDCGKLQTLSRLLRRLKAGGHRVLIFTQMTRVLDVLEAFLSMHGHTYLRLDGATKVEARQPLVDRFNSDARVFAMILSTRSGGVGLNLTGADCVVFYDSDWNPTMDAQAQDRAHRIGQTRDVHVFRLVTAATVEENILRKADQKRKLGHLAIEDGHFTTSVLRQANIKELFGAENCTESSDTKENDEQKTGGAGAGAGQGGAGTAGQGGELETALAACEDEADALAARLARAEQRHDLAEFDETLPLDDDAADAHAPPPAPAHAPTAAAADTHDRTHAGEFAALMKQLTPIEKYAMRLVESSEAATEAERAALDDMRRQLRDWEDKRRALREPEPQPPAPPPPEPDPDVTYSREDGAKVRPRRRRAPPAPAPAPPPSPPPSPPAAPPAKAPRTRSRGTVHINLWTLDKAGGEPAAGGAGAGPGGRRRALRNGTLDTWLARTPRQPHDDDDNDNK